jgi:hypothetical protein
MDVLRRAPEVLRVMLSDLSDKWAIQLVHDLNHLGQIVKTMAKQYTHAIGPWREFLPVVDSP